MNTDFSPLDRIERAFRVWWLLVALALLGALVGLGLFLLRRPVYEASITYTFSIDFSQAGFLSDFEEDQALESAGDILESSLVVDQVIADASAQGIALDAQSWKAMASRERGSNVWVYRVRSTDPAQAAKLANLWGERGSAALTEGLAHSLAAGQIQRNLSSLEDCLSQAVASEPAQAYCQYTNLADIQAKIAESGQALSQEKLAGLGLLPGISFLWTEKASIPTRPVLNDRGQLMLVGAVVGVVLALILVETGVMDVLAGKRRHGA